MSSNPNSITIVPKKVPRIIMTMIESAGSKQKLIDLFPNFVQTIADCVKATQYEWRKMVGQSGARREWKEGYQKAILREFKPPFEGRVYALGDHVNWIENGVPRWDMKVQRGKYGGLLFGHSPSTQSKPHISKDGSRWRVIFMPKTTPSTGGSSAMPQNVYEKAKALSYGQSLRGMGNFGMNEKQKAQAEANQWKSGLFEGLTKTGKKGHSSYGTFRIISNKKGNENKWWVKATPAFSIFPKLISKIQPVIDKKMNEALQLDMKNGA